jgi:nicotinamidase-related amidase
MGPTIPELRELLDGVTPLPKTAFSAWKDPAVYRTIRETGCRDILIAGIETHICIYQTAMDLLHENHAAQSDDPSEEDEAYTVRIALDAVSSRTTENKAAAIQRMRDFGAEIETVEMILFEQLETSGHPSFRDILRIVK